ncbi:MAG TPA: hypothetical protein VEV45_16815 [Streptosporangiaceae bacterium]|nr:hypothetical protein [Streptosporangiaceae bacterium]
MNPDHSVEGNGQVISQRVAELAGELSEAQEESRRKRIARQISELAGRGGHAAGVTAASRAGAAWRGTQAGATTAWRRLQSGAGGAARRTSPARDAAGRRLVAGRDAAVHRAQAGGSAARRGAQSGGAAAWHSFRAAGDWLTAQAVDMAPRVPIRSIDTLRRQYPGLDTEQLAERLIATAARASSGVGAAIGAAAAVPFVPTLPMELGVETLALVAVELKLVAELHEVYGQQAPGTRSARMLAYLTAWSQRRGVRLTSNGIAIAVGSPVRRQLERRLLAKAGQSTLALAPLLTGAVAGAVIDHHETRRLGNLVRADLRKRTAAALEQG